MGWKTWNKTVYSNYTMEDKYNIVCRKLHELENYDDYDEASFTSYVKELFENGNVYISCELAKIGLQNMLIITQRNQNVNNNPAPSTSKVPYGSFPGVVREHVVPTSLIIKEVIDLYRKGQFTLDKYKQIVNKCGAVCIVTKVEDECLTNASLRQSMPAGKSIYDVWSRYDEVGIKIY